MATPTKGERVTVFDECDLPRATGVVSRFDQLEKFNRVLIESGETDRRLTLPARGFFWVREVGASWEGLELATHRSRTPLAYQGRCVKVRPSRSPDDLMAVAGADRRYSLMAKMQRAFEGAHPLDRWTQEKVDGLLEAWRRDYSKGPVQHELGCDMDEDCRCAPADR